MLYEEKIANGWKEVFVTPGSNLQFLARVQDVYGKKEIQVILIKDDCIYISKNYDPFEIKKQQSIYELFKDEIDQELARRFDFKFIKNYSFDGSLNSRIKEIKRCVRCIDFGSKDKEDKKRCLFCTRCNFAMSGDGKIDFYASSDEERNIQEKEYEEVNQNKNQGKWQKKKEEVNGK